VELSVQVCNAGAVAAAAVVQVYLEPPGLAVERPPRTLVAFQRVPLAPGESRRISLEVPPRRLAFFDEQRDGFVLEGGRHRLVVAQHSEDPGLVCELELQPDWVGP
jgi:beta-glucosidase